MTPRNDERIPLVRPRHSAAQPGVSLLAAICLLATAVAALLCSSVRLDSAPRTASGPLNAGRVLAEGPVPASAALAPFLNLVPTTDGDLWVHAAGTGPLAGTVVANTEIGPGHHKGGWTMAFTETLDGYVNVETVVMPSSAQDDYGALSITTTHGLDSGWIHFERYYVPPDRSGTLSWPDGSFELDLPSGDTFSTDTYLVVALSWGLPRPVPLGHWLASEAYSVRASGAQQETNRPMLLRFYVSADRLGDADPHTLAVFGWDASAERWEDLDATLFAERSYLSAATRALTTYALMSRPAWRDTFDDHTGLSERSNVVWGGSIDDLALVLAGTERTGYAISVPITGTRGARWDRLVYSATVETPTQTLPVDLIEPDGTLVRAGLPSGADLSDLDTVRYPALKLRANLGTTVGGESPALYEWELVWRAESSVLYLPVIVNE